MLGEPGAEVTCLGVGGEELSVCFWVVAVLLGDGWTFECTAGSGDPDALCIWQGRQSHSFPYGKKIRIATSSNQSAVFSQR